MTKAEIYGPSDAEAGVPSWTAIVPARRDGLVRLSPYEAKIRSLIPDDVDPRYVEAWMRVEHSTLDGLSPSDFRGEVAIAVQCVYSASKADNEAIAGSFGL